MIAGMGITERLQRLVRAYRLRPEDVLVASFPRSGNTWVRFVFANIVSDRELGGQDVDFHTVNSRMLYAYDSGVYSRFEPRTVPRFVKTHLEFTDRKFGRNRSLFIFRNPGDVMVSYYEYRNSTVGTESTTFDEFISSKEFGLPAWIAHYKSWISRATAVTSYEGMRTRPVDELSNVMNALSIDVQREELERAVTESSIEKVQARERRTGHPDEMATFTTGHRFARKGTVGQYEGQFKKANMRYLIDTLVESGLHEIAQLYQ